MKEPAMANCPECGAQMESGFLQAPSFGICWTNDASARGIFIFSSKVERLQKDWWGFPKLAKDKLHAKRCRHCNLVLFRHEGKAQQESANQQLQAIAPPRGSA